jgi:Fe-S-cluster containining protein
MANFTNVWQLIHELFAGEMPECLGAACPNNCCGEKIAKLDNLQPDGGSKLQYRTSCRAEELEFLQKSDIPQVVFKQVRVAGEDKYYIDGCFQERGGCRFKEVRPWACKIHPFDLVSVDKPINIDECPAALGIGSNEKTLATILRIRRAIGFADNKLWLENLVRLIKCRKEGVRNSM